MRHGMPPILKLQSLGMKPSLSVAGPHLREEVGRQRALDIGMNLQRVILNQMILNQGSAPDAVDWGLPGPAPDVPNGDQWPTPPAGSIAPLTTRDVLRFGTMNAAKALRLEGKADSLTPGKEADIIILDATRINVVPLNQVPGAVVPDGPHQRRDRDRCRQGAQMERAIARRRSAASARAARGFA
jgi:5-methylthioadenosine/S-adenosylhomocysteine deaminase